MILELTDKPSSKKIYVNVAQIKLVEDHADGAHVVFSGDMGRVVTETKEQIFKMMGIFPVTSPIQSA
jgi:hypothetical protein